MMRLLWTFVKVVLALALSGAIAIMVLPMVLGMIGALVGLAALTLRLAFVGLIAWALFRLAVALFGGRKSAEPMQVRDLPRPDPYYEAAKRELDQELGEVSR